MNAARQVVHILVKDIRGHALEIGLVLALNVVLVLTLTVTWAEVQNPNVRTTPIGDVAQILLVVAWCALIARVVQGDGLAGKAPYWLTRPWSRPALLASKVAFVLLFVHLPAFLSQLAIVTGSGVPLSPPQLFANQALFAAGVSLPLMALAALTTTFSRFLFCGVALAVPAVYLFSRVDTFANFLVTAVLTLLVLIASVALACQYRWRSTLRVAAWSLVALLGLGALTLASSYYGYMQRGQVAFIEPPTVPPTIRLLAASERDARYPPPFVSLPIDAPFTDDTFVRYYKIDVLSADGREVDLVGWGARLRRSGESDNWLDLQLTPADYESLKDSFVSIRLVADVETFENRAMEPIPLDGSFAIVGDRAQCGTSDPYTIFCRTSFGRSVWRLDDANTEARLRWLPLRLSFALNPIEFRQVGFSRPPNQFTGASVATVLREPSSFTRQDVTFENIRLGDWGP